MADGVNNSSIRILGQVANILPKREAPAGGSHTTSVASDAYLRNDGQANMRALADLVAEMEARIAALEDKVSDLYDEETFAPVKLGELAKPAANNAPAVNNAPVANNAPATNNGAPLNNRPLTAKAKPAANDAPATDDDAPVAKNAPAKNAPAKNAPAKNAKPTIDLDVLPAPDDDVPAIPSRVAKQPTAGAKAAPAEATAKQPEVLEPATMYTVQKGDTLWDIAARELGDATRFQEIADANADAYPSLGANPDLIQPGWELVLPTGGRVAAPAEKPAPALPAAEKPAPAKPVPTKPAPTKPAPVKPEATKPAKGPKAPEKKQPKPAADEPKVIIPEVLPPEDAVPAAKPVPHKPGKPMPKPTSDAPVPIDMTGVVLGPGADWDITNQDTKVTGVGTETDTHWEVGADGKAKATNQDTKITDADTNTKTRWEAPKPGAKPAKGGNVQNGDAPVPIDMSGIRIDPLKGFDIASQSTTVEAVETNTDTHWEVGPDGKAKATNQDTNVTAADTVTRTRWVAKGSVVPQPTTPAEKPPAPKPTLDAEAAAWLRANLGSDGRISRKEIEAMPAGPGRDAILAHFDALLFGYIDAGPAGWTDLHEGDVKRLEQALKDGGSIKGLAGQLTKWVHSDRKPGDLDKDGELGEGDVAAYAGRLRAGQVTGGEPTPASPPAANTGDARLQADLDAFLKNHKGKDDVVHLMKNQPQYLRAATMEQKGRLIKQCLDGFTGEEGRKAALFILEAGAEKGELMGVLNQVHEKKKLAHLFEDVAGHREGEKMAALFAKHGVYKNSGVVNAMTGSAVADYVKALGFKHPMIGTSDDLRALPEGHKRAMIQKLLQGEFTQTDHRQATWINTHLDAPVDIPRYDPFEHQRGR